MRRVYRSCQRSTCGCSVCQRKRRAERECQRCLHRQSNILLARKSGTRRPSTGACASTYQCASRTTRQGSDGRSHAGPAADQNPVALFVPAAFATHMRRLDVVPSPVQFKRIQTEAHQRPALESAGGLRFRQMSSARRATRDDRPSIPDDRPDQRSPKRIARPVSLGVQRLFEADVEYGSGGN